MTAAARHAGLVILALALGSNAAEGVRAARAETALEAWERIESIKQAEGSAAARPEARTAIAAYPAFTPLITQYARICTSAGGFAAAQALVDSLRAHATLSQARAAEIFLALERGASQAALDTLALLPPEPPGTPREAFRDLDLVVASLGAGRIERADSLLHRLEDRPAFGRGRFVSRYMDLFLEQPRASLELQQGRADAAIARLATAAERAKRAGLRDLRMRILHLRARLLAAQGQPKQAVVDYQAALDLAHGIHDDWQRATTSAWLAWTLERLERFGEAFELRRQGLDLFPYMGDPIGMAYTLLGLGWDAINVGKLGLAEDTLQRAIDFAREHEWTWMEGQALMNLGVLHSEQGQFDLALQDLQGALALAEQTHNERQRTGILNDLAILHMETNRPDRAIPIYRKLLAIHRANGDVDSEIHVLNNMALASENMGQLAQARTLYEHCLKVAAEHGRSNNAACINLGRLLSTDRLWTRGDRYLRDAIEDARRRESTGDLIDAEGQLGRSLSFQGRMEEARSHLETADSLRVATGLIGLRVPDLIRLALVRFALERWHEALAALDEALALAVRVAPVHVATVHALRASVLLALGEIEPARAEARVAETSAQNGSIREASPYIAQMAAGEAISVLLRSARDASGAERTSIVEEAFDMLQRVQSRSLLEYVQGGQRRIEPDVPDSLVRHERAARRSVDEIRRSIDEAGATSNLDSLRVALAEAQTVQDQLRTVIFRSDRRYHDVSLPPEFDTDALHELVGPGTLVLDYLTGRECEAQFPCDAFVFAVDAEGMKAYPLGDTSNLDHQVRLLADLLADPPEAGGDATQLLLRELGKTLLGPVADRLDRYDTIVIVPDGSLSGLPFAALLLPSPASRSGDVHLVEVAAIETVPSLAVLHQLQRGEDERPGSNDRWDIAIWPSSEETADGDSTEVRAFDLPHARDELRKLTSLLPRSTILDVNLQDEPSLAVQLASLSALGSSEVLHFIAHGFFDDLQPWRSGLYLQPSPAGGEPRKLEIADVYRMNLRSRLVTLSACDTARGGDNDGVGFLGFTQALLGSGATSVLATLWSIDDASTPEFMASFYEGLGDGLSEAQALRRAQLRFLADDTLSHPFYWAPYVLLGDGSQGIPLTLRRRSPFTAPATLLGLGGLLLLAGLWAWRRQRPA